MSYAYRYNDDDQPLQPAQRQQLPEHLPAEDIGSQGDALDVTPETA